MTLTEDKFFWISVQGKEKKARQRLILDAIENGFTDIVVSDEELELLRGASFRPLQVKDGFLFEGGEKIGRYVRIAGEEDMPDISRIRLDFLVVEMTDWKVIPVENLIALCTESGTKLVVAAKSAEEAELFLGTLEKGADGILAVVSDHNDIDEFGRLLRSRNPVYKLEEAEVISVSHAGMGDRVCIDTCSILSEGEGMLVGSQSSFLFLIHSESLESKFVSARPFRVNAGPVHSYILSSGGRTSYLSELKSGMQLPAVKADGTSRKVTVGRVKIERRPLLLVRAAAGGEECSILLQNAETVNLCTPSGHIPVTDLRKGDSVIIFRQEGARHFGMSVHESVFER
jgi:3-dehydroquinate synthase II